MMNADKGIAFSSLAMVAVIGVGAIVGYMALQAKSGVWRREQISKKRTLSQPRATLETVKRFSAINLKVASKTAALDVASAGGTLGGGRYWWSGNPPKPTPPSLDQVNYALSVKANRGYNSYLQGTRNGFSQYGVKVNDCDCVGINAPKESKCPPQDSEGCESFKSYAQDQLISVEEVSGAKDRYRGNLAADVAGNRFYWTYYNTKRGMKKLQSWVNNKLGQICDGPESDRAKLQSSINHGCDQLDRKMFDDNVEVSCNITCLDTSGSCLNSETASSFDKDTCWAQGTTSGSFRLNVNVTDYKYTVNGEHLTWNLMAALEAGQNCEVVD